MELNLTNYLSYLNNIIKKRGQWPDEVRYSKRTCERHHIILKCKGGQPEYLNWQHHENIIWLYPEEHFEAHKILYLDNKNDIQIANSFILMSNTKMLNLSSSEYELMKIAASSVHKHLRKDGHGPRLGMQTSEETKAKMRLAQLGEKNNWYGKIWVHNNLKQIKINPIDLQEYLKNGWLKGTLGLTTEQKEKDRKAIAGRIHIHNANVRKMIWPNELQNYLNNGWIVGRGKIERKK